MVYNPTGNTSQLSLLLCINTTLLIVAVELDKVTPQPSNGESGVKEGERGRGYEHFTVNVSHLDTSRLTLTSGVVPKIHTTIKKLEWN